MSDNLSIYNAVRVVPKEALKEIQAGRLRGKSDINPMWRIKSLTEQFGPCGIGWKAVIKEKRIEQGGNSEIAAFVDIDLFIKVDGQWSEAIPGTGGSSFVASEKNGLYVSDECFKMAFTDAISVACKMLGFGADVYWNDDSTKYNKPQGTPQANNPADDHKPATVGTAKATGGYDVISEPQAKRLFAIAKGETKEAKAESVKMVIAKYGYKNTKDISKAEYQQISDDIESMPF